MCIRDRELEVADEDPGQSAGEEQAHGDDAGGGREEPQAEAQLAASSRR